MRRSFVAAALALPLVVLALGIVRSERHLRENRRWTFELTGYDPRDLLRGHYIQYRLALDESLPRLHEDAEACDDTKGDRCCLCLAADNPDDVARMQRMTCELARERCDGALGLRYLDELERYYKSEERADELTKLVQDASLEHRAHLVVAIDKSGKPQIDALLVDGIPIEEPR